MASAKNTDPYIVVVGTDYSPSGTLALQLAMMAAGRRSSEVHVVSALGGTGSARSQASIQKLDRALEKARARLDAHIAKVKEAIGYNGLIRGHIRLADPAPAILQCAVDVNADLIVVGETHKKGLAKLVLSTTAAKVMDRASCPVLLARPKNHAAMPKTTGVEPVCKACQRVRESTNGNTWWCATHAANRHMDSHVYKYRARTSIIPEVPRGGT